MGGYRNHSDVTTFVLPSVAPGMITPWSGAIVDIPSGWTLCDSNNGTPDLRDKFIVGAGDTYSVDDTGGATPHSHPFISDVHFHNIDSGLDINGGTDYTASVESKSISGTTDTDPGLPKYFALAYIMYTG